MSSVRRQQSTDRAVGQHLLGSVLWLATAQFFVAEAIVESRWSAPYDRRSYYISDLGALNCAESSDGRLVCSPWHAVMNASFVLQGVLIIGGALLLHHDWTGGSARMRVATTGLFVAAGAGVALVGLAPEDTVFAAHYLGAAANFTAGNTGLVALSFAARPVLGLRVASVWVGALGVIGLTALACFLAGANWGLGIGGIERVVAYAVPAGLPVVALSLLLARRHR